MAVAYWVRLLNACIRGEIRLSRSRIAAICKLFDKVLPDVKL